jgi:exodeoxyribonuclease VII large subunit
MAIDYEARTVPNPLTVTALTRLVKGALEAAFPPLWVEGEVTGFRASAAGHLYFSLKDEQSQVRVVMFRNRGQRLRFSPRDGMRLLVLGNLTVYEARGEYQLLAEDLEMRGAGAAALALAELRRRLAAEGLFDAARKRPLPSHPSSIGVVTSPTGAAVHDVVEVLRARRAAVSVVLAPALVQGEEAPESIVAALALLAEWGKADLVICGRGGGSSEDLAAFSDERVVRAVAAHPAPVISAVGHQIDSALCDLSADAFAPTPSAAAEMAAPAGEETADDLIRLSRDLAAALSGRVAAVHLRLAALKAQLVHPRARLTQGKLLTDELSFRLSAAARAMLADRQSGIYRLAGMLDSLSPLAVLGRGYAILRKVDGKVVRRADEVEEGERLSARLARGELILRVRERE